MFADLSIVSTYLIGILLRAPKLILVFGLGIRSSFFWRRLRLRRRQKHGNTKVKGTNKTKERQQEQYKNIKMQALEDIASNILKELKLLDLKPTIVHKSSIEFLEKLLLLDLEPIKQQQTPEDNAETDDILNNNNPTFYTPTSLKTTSSNEESSTTTHNIKRKKNILSLTSNTTLLLEDYTTSFSKKFYKLLYQFLCEGYSQSLQQQLQCQEDDEHFSYVYSLERNQIHIRVTRILHCIILHHDTKYDFCWYTFINSVQQQEQQQNIPLLYVILFKYISNVSILESFVHTLERKSRYVPSNTQQQTNTSNRMIIIQSSVEFCTRIQKEWKTHLEKLEYIIGEIYEMSSNKHRCWLRNKIGTRLHNFSILSSTNSMATATSSKYMENTIACGIDIYLYVLLRIIPSFHTSSSKSNNQEKAAVHYQLLFKILMPLHKTNLLILWRDQIPILSQYHEPLVLCIIGILRLYPDWMEQVLVELCTSPSILPSDQGNTPKLVLLLHEIDTIISSIPSSEDIISVTTLQSLLTRLNACIQGDNSRTAEQALQFWKNTHFESLLKVHRHDVMRMLLHMICRVDGGMEKSWNPTVNKMLFLVLNKIELYDIDLFKVTVESMFSGSGGRLVNPSKMEERKEEDNSSTLSYNTKKKKVVLSPSSSSGTVITSNMMTLKGAMGDWKPPSSGNRKLPSHNNNKPPPLTVTGVAPWAMQNHSSMPPPTSSTSKRPMMKFKNPIIPKQKQQHQPPLTVTGVGPWAISSGLNSSTTTNNNKRIHNQLPQQQKSTKSNGEEKPTITTTTSKSKAFQKFLEYKNSLCPPSSSGNALEDWSKVQLAETPTLLPNLKFHDLVFGHVLGKGAFSEVKYAKKIERDRTRSFWQEFAVKIVSIHTITALGYSQAVSREINILRTLSHPNINRLISSFRFKSGVYLILEYAAKGDLHTAIHKLGGNNKLSSNPKQIQFVMGEILAALIHVHEKGYVFGDLKPENVLICQSDHVKLADFGACRISTRNKEDENVSNVLKDLRNGDWRDQGNKVDIVEEEEEDVRIEGTAAYLPPEVVMGDIPTSSADTWAFGCVLYQCFTAKPPLLSENDEYTKHKIVTFDISSPETEDDIFTNEPAFSSLSLDEDDDLVVKRAQELIRQCLQFDPKERLLCTGIQQHFFFKGMDVLSLYKEDAYPFDFDSSDNSTTSGGDSNSSWARRQFSSIWSPQPQKYSIGNNGISSKSTMTNHIDKSIFRKCLILEEEEERNHYFLVLNNDTAKVNTTTITSSSGCMLPLVPTSLSSGTATATTTVTTSAMEIIEEEDDDK